MPVRALASINLAAIERNVTALRRRLATGTRLCAVVKGDGYGHGALPVAGAALEGGASCLAVATGGEARELREAGIGAPILVLGALSASELAMALGARAEVVAWTQEFVDEVVAARAGGAPAAQAAGAAGSSAQAAPVRVHVKLDTGMGRLGTREPAQALAVAERVLEARPALALAGVMTHFATADGDLEFVDAQRRQFAGVADALRRRCPAITVHAANSAAALRAPDTHFDLVRCGIAIYGADPMNADASAHGLEPALTLRSYVAAVKLARAGDSTGYGRKFIAPQDTWIATVPIGYADGIRRALSGRGEVLIGGRRYPIAGAVSMDNITVALGSAPAARVGDVATIIGTDGGERQTVEHLAQAIDTINYEVLTGISKRVARVYHRDGTPA